MCEILRIVTIYIVINSTHVSQHMRVTISCRYCIAFEVMLLFLLQFYINSGVTIHEKQLLDC